MLDLLSSLAVTLQPTRKDGFGRAVLDVVPGAGILEGMRRENVAVGDSLFDQRDSRPSGAGCGESDAVLGEQGVDLVGNGRDRPEQQLCGDSGGGFAVVVIGEGLVEAVVPRLSALVGRSRSS